VFASRLTTSARILVLAYLRQFPIDVLKIDRSFVSGIADSRNRGARTYSGAAGQGARIETSEGVETNDQRSRLETNTLTRDGLLVRAATRRRDLDRLLLNSSGKPEWLSVALPRDDA